MVSRVLAILLIVLAPAGSGVASSCMQVARPYDELVKDMYSSADVVVTATRVRDETGRPHPTQFLVNTVWKGDVGSVISVIEHKDPEIGPSVIFAHGPISEGRYWVEECPFLGGMNLDETVEINRILLRFYGSGHAPSIDPGAETVAWFIIFSFAGLVGVFGWIWWLVRPNITLERTRWVRQRFMRSLSLNVSPRGARLGLRR